MSEVRDNSRAMPVMVAGEEERAPHLIGRSAERAVITAEVASARAGDLRVVTFEGEVGIGKSRLLALLAAAARQQGFLVATAIADEDVRAPLLAVRALLTTLSDAVAAPEVGTNGILLLDQALEEEQERVRVFDALARWLRQLATRQPLALLVDDLQWSDEASLHVLRHLTRAAPHGSILLGLALRADEVPGTSTARRFVADLERVRGARRLRPARLSFTETSDLLAALLAGPVTSATATVIYTQSEGVPLFVEELVRQLTDDRILHQIDGVWGLARVGVQRLPGSVQLLVEGRAARLPAATRALLADAAIVGRRFDLATLARLQGQPGAAEQEVALAGRLATAVRAGLLVELADDERYDYAFTHEQYRAALAAIGSRPRRRQVHSALADLLSVPGDRSFSTLAAITQHLLAAGRAEEGIAQALIAAPAALNAGAPEEALRMLHAAHGAAMTPENRSAILQRLDDALAAAERHEERMAGLAELAALATALGDETAEWDALIRRASAARATADEAQAADLARRVVERARAYGNREMELRALLELGQVLLQSPLGEAFEPTPDGGHDLDGAAVAFAAAAQLASELEQPRDLAAATRELGVIAIGRGRKARSDLADTAPPETDLYADPRVVAHYREAERLLDEALALYERLGDERGTMSTLIALAYAQTPGTLPRGEMGRIAQIRRLRVRSLTGEAEQAHHEAQMLYGVHLYGRAFGYLDLALEHGVEAYQASHAVGDRDLAFLAAGSMAETHLLLGDVAAAETWLDLARDIARDLPTALRARRLEGWRGHARAVAGDSAGTRQRLRRLLELAQSLGPVEAAESLAPLALQAALIEDASDELRQAVREAALLVLQLVPGLVGPLPWEAEAQAALACVTLAEGDAPGACDLARQALASLERRDPVGMQLELYQALAQALAGSASDELAALILAIRALLRRVFERTLDRDVRTRFFAAPPLRRLSTLAGDPGEAGMPARASALDVTLSRKRRHLVAGLTEREVDVLRLVACGKTNREIAAELFISEKTVKRHLSNIFNRINVATRAAATAFAVREGLA